jgi:hypothetical protein
MVIVRPPRVLDGVIRVGHELVRLLVGTIEEQERPHFSHRRSPRLAVTVIRIRTPPISKIHPNLGVA